MPALPDMPVCAVWHRAIGTWAGNQTWVQIDIQTSRRALPVLLSPCGSNISSLCITASAQVPSMRLSKCPSVAHAHRALLRFWLLMRSIRHVHSCRTADRNAVSLWPRVAHAQRILDRPWTSYELMSDRQWPSRCSNRPSSLWPAVASAQATLETPYRCTKQCCCQSGLQ